MNYSPLFTIILSGYQTEPYLQKALDSVANQTFRDFEVICYVEESTDHSLEMCQTMAKRDPRFKVATGPKSGGVGTTRNYGIDHASGKYLVILDGDDWLAEDMLEKLDRKLTQTGEVDVLSFACARINNENDVPVKTISNFTQEDAEIIFPGQDAIRRTQRHTKGLFHGYAWLNTCRLAFLKAHNLYQQKEFMEDVEWTPRVWFYAEKMVYIDDPLYYYRNRPNSLTTESPSSTRIMLALSRKVFPSLFEFACQESFPEDILSIWGNIWLSMLYWYMFHPITSKNTSDEVRKQALDTLFSGKGRDHFKQILPHVSFPKRLAAPFVLLAANGIQFPAKAFFRGIYYPLIKRRNV